MATRYTLLLALSVLIIMDAYACTHTEFEKMKLKATKFQGEYITIASYLKDMGSYNYHLGTHSVLPNTMMQGCIRRSVLKCVDYNKVSAIVYIIVIMLVI